MRIEYAASLAVLPLLLAGLIVLVRSRHSRPPAAAPASLAAVPIMQGTVDELRRVLGAHIDSELAAIEERIREELELAIADVNRRISTVHAGALRELTRQANRRPAP